MSWKGQTASLVDQMGKTGFQLYGLTITYGKQLGPQQGHYGYLMKFFLFFTISTEIFNGHAEFASEGNVYTVWSTGLRVLFSSEPHDLAGPSPSAVANTITVTVFSAAINSPAL